MQQYKLELKAQFLNCSKVQDYIDAGLSEEDAGEFFIGKTKNQKLQVVC